MQKLNNLFLKDTYKSSKPTYFRKFMGDEEGQAVWDTLYTHAVLFLKWMVDLYICFKLSFKYTLY